MAIKSLHSVLVAHIRRVWRVLLPLSLCASFVLVNQAFVHLHWPIWAFLLIGMPLSAVIGFIIGLVATIAVTLWIDRKNLEL